MCCLYANNELKIPLLGVGGGIYQPSQRLGYLHWFLIVCVCIFCGEKPVTLIICQWPSILNFLASDNFSLVVLLPSPSTKVITSQNQPSVSWGRPPSSSRWAQDLITLHKETNLLSTSSPRNANLICAYSLVGWTLEYVWSRDCTDTSIRNV